MDYDQLIQKWEEGDREVVAAEVAQMQPSEILAFAQVFLRAARGESQFVTLERMVRQRE